MLSASELEFATRENADLPAWISDPEGRQSLRLWREPDAKTVTLRLGRHGVLVRVREMSSVFVGEISGFEPSVAELRGMRAGDLIVFRQAHIFAATE
jgi:hypothetical protein